MLDEKVVPHQAHVRSDDATVAPFQPASHGLGDNKEEASLGRDGGAVLADSPVAFLAGE